MSQIGFAYSYTADVYGHLEDYKKFGKVSRKSEDDVSRKVLFVIMLVLLE